MYQFPTTEHVVTELDSGFIPLVMAMTKEDAARLKKTKRVSDAEFLRELQERCSAGEHAAHAGTSSEM